MVKIQINSGSFVLYIDKIGKIDHDFRIKGLQQQVKDRLIFSPLICFGKPYMLI